MSVVTIDKATRVLVVDGKKLFPIGLSNGPPAGVSTPGGRDGLAEVKAGGVSLLRTGFSTWTPAQVDAQIAAERARLDAAGRAGLHCWTWLGQVPNLPAGGSPPTNEQLLVKIVGALKDHPALAAYKGVDEPRNPIHGPDFVPPDGLVRAYAKLKAIDPDHPVVIVQTPRNTVAQLTPYRPALDVTGADIYPVSYPPGIHAASGNDDINVVGDVTRTLVAAAGDKPVWMTLQIAWSGVTPTKATAHTVPRFPSLPDERFMAYQAIANGARGLVFFGGHLTQIAGPADARAGWNWTFWERVLKPLLAELTSTAVGPALVAPDSAAKVTTGAPDVELVTRQDASFVYVIAVRRGAGTSQVSFSGLPRRHDGKAIGGGEVLFEYAQSPPPPPITPGRQQFRTVGVAGGSFSDWFGPHDAHVYRFPL